MTALARQRGPALTCVVLAAGGSSRLGTAKQLVRFRGRALLERAVAAAACATGSPPVVVVGAQALRLRALLARAPFRCTVVTNAQWRFGLASSLQAGLAAVPADTRAALFMLTDQPLVDAAALSRLIAAWRRRPTRAAAARYSGRLGVPAILPKSAWPALRALSGDVGARGVLEAAAAVTAVDMPEAALDVDARADVARLAGASKTTASPDYSRG